MKNLLTLISLAVLMSSCNQFDDREQALQGQIDELQTKLDNAYKPGFGDFMGNIQKHHNKLWFAGVNENWELAAFEIHELEEIFEDIESTYPDREETQHLPMIEPGLEAVENAIEQQDKVAFEQKYIAFTKACNACHKITKHEFINIVTPTIPAYSNQDFKRYFEK